MKVSKYAVVEQGYSSVCYFDDKKTVDEFCRNLNIKVRRKKIYITHKFRVIEIVPSKKVSQ